jgi:phospholipid/cholesterol/gamma-HCH transport system permease protein
MAVAPAHGETAPIEATREGALLHVALKGAWTIGNAARLETSLDALAADDASEIEIDGGQLERLDSAGAWLILRLSSAAQAAGKSVRLKAMPETLAFLEKNMGEGIVPPQPRPSETGFVALLERLGRAVCGIGAQAYALVGYLGLVTVESGQTAVRHRRLRFVPFLSQIERTGVDALPIIGLLGFLLGIVIAYQGVEQLKRFGAQIFTVNLVSVAMLREIGVIITSIMVAGRSGSAFTAQIGTMKLNYEVDALRTMGVNVIEILVIPRLLALLITLPLLTFFADILGLLGGATMCYFSLGISIPAFLHQLQGAIGPQTFLVGLVKAPFFAVLIALVSTFEGLQVKGDAASVGMHTTRAVVESVFLVIVCDAAFSILFSVIGF